MNWSTLLFGLVLSAFLFGRAAAQPVDAGANASARRHFQDGSKAFSLGEFTRAIQEYRAAYNVKPDPAFLYNIAQSYRLAGDSAQAIFFYRSYLSNLPEAPNRREVETRIAALEAQRAQEKARLAATTPTAATTTTANPTPANAATTSLPAGAQPELLSTTASAGPKRTPVYKKWWLWTIVGGVAAGAAVGVAVGVTQSQPHFATPLGTIGPALTVGR